MRLSGTAGSLLGGGLGGGTTRLPRHSSQPPVPRRPTLITALGGDDTTKLAVAAKISAARTLARKLAEEKQAAATAAKLGADQAADPQAAADMVRSAELEVAEVAKEAAKADSLVRAARKADKGSPQLLELQRLKEQNEALMALVMQLASNREEAERRLEELQRKPTAASPPTAGGHTAALATVVRNGQPTLADMTEVQLQAWANNAATAGRRVFTAPEGPALVGTTVRLLYNLAGGTLPQDSTALALKVGLNKWETILEVPMTPVPGLDAHGRWFSADLDLPALLYRVDYVVVDSSSGLTDNNSYKDFQLELAEAPTEGEVAAARLEMLEDFDAAAAADFEAHEEAVEADWMKAAKGAAEEARLAYVNVRREALLAEAEAVVQERRGPLSLPPSATAASKEGVFAWMKAPEAGGTCLLVYNKGAGPLQGAGSVVAHVGYDGWWMKDKRVLPMRPLAGAEAKRAAKLGPGEWWGVEVAVWNTAAVLDFAFTNDARSVWDNDEGVDYHTAVKGAASGKKLVQLVFQALDVAGADDAARGERLAARRVLQRAQVKAAAARRRRELQRRFLYTEPIAPRAGTTVRVFYNPEDTALRGRPEITLQASFNRGTHPASPPVQRMEPAVPAAGGLGFLVATLEVPKDAYMLDCSFYDSADAHGGFQDDNRGLEYHIPVAGCAGGAAPPLRVAHVASEMAPIAKAGGLGDVVTALGRAVQEEGHDIEIVLPKYDCIDYAQVTGLVQAGDFFCEGTQVKIWRGTVEGLTTTFLEPCNGMFWIGSIYTDMAKDRHRFGMFCASAMEYLRAHSPVKPDVLHAHDWQSAPVLAGDRAGMAAAFTIHNLNYGADLIGLGMGYTDVATTVSPTYAAEVGGHPSIAPHHEKFYGIRNGIDTEIWDPASDPTLPVGYTAEDAAEGKAAARVELRRRLGLAEGDVPLVGCVTRLTHQKGIHLIKHAAWRAVERGAQFVLLGSAPEPKVQAEFDALAADLGRQYPDRARLWFAYDEPLSHLIYAASDLFLVPSMFEPCGLTQMIAMRYGAVPVVRRTGGLADTVFDLDDDQERAAAQGLEVNGFSFDSTDSGGMDYALNRALAAWYSDREAWGDLVQRVMRMDWSWSSPAQDYLELYYRALKK